MKGLEIKLENLDALTGSVDGMKGCLKEIQDQLGPSTLEEEGADASSKTLYATKHRRVDSNAACLPAQAH